MTSPWLNIPYDDYENHMTEVGQAQVLNNLTKYCLDKYAPKHFALLGCATGNGLEHINIDNTIAAYAIDINQDYLDIVWRNYGASTPGLITMQADIEKDELNIQNIDLVFAGLLLEYVKPLTALRKIIQILSPKGVLFVVIQKNKQDSFVSKTKYHSLKKLGSISKNVDEQEINSFLNSQKLELIKREEIILNQHKSFIALEYQQIL